MNIKGKEIGIGRPLVCVPIIEKNQTAVYREAQRLADCPEDMIEWRMDWYENWKSTEELCSIITELKEILKEKILLCTFRSKSQGGESEISQTDYAAMLKTIAKQSRPEMLDIEVSELDSPRELIRELQKTGVTIVASEHDFEKTPSASVMREKLLYMKELGADIAKLAVMPENKQDVLKLLEATAQVKEICPQYPVITMSMGKLGMVSRITGQIFGSCVTFAAAGKTSAPGQMLLEDVAIILHKISESMEK